MTDNEYRKTRKAAVDALIYWAKTGMRQFTGSVSLSVSEASSFKPVDLR